MAGQTQENQTFQIGGTTDAGRSGKNNEDNYDTFLAQCHRAEFGRTSPVQVMVVADGIGGVAGGELASQIAVQKIRTWVAQPERTAVPIPQRLQEALQQANSGIHEAASNDPSFQGMGTTIVTAAIMDNILYVAHAGDSRAYLIRGGHIHMLTLDHTWAQEAIDVGRLSAEEAKRHPNRNVIRRYLGINERVEIDPLIVDPPSHPGTTSAASRKMVDHLILERGDVILLCTDGLTDVVSDPEIEKTVNAYIPQKAVSKLIDMANAAGGPDNITAVIVEVPGGGKKRSAAFKRSYGLMALIAIAALAVIFLTVMLFNSFGTDITDVSVIGNEEQGVEQQGAELVEVAATEMPTDTPIPATAAVEPTIQIVGTAPQIGSLETTTQEEASDGKPESTLAPTSTPLSISTPVPDIVDIPEPTTTPSEVVQLPPTLIPESTSATITSTVESAAIEESSPAIDPNLSVTLVSPDDGDGLSGLQIFQWIAGFELQEGQAFELTFWKEGQNPLTEGVGPIGSKSDTTVTVDLGAARDALSLNPGEHYWGVRLVEIEPYKVLQLLGGQRRFVLGSSGGSSSSSSCVGIGCSDK